MKFATYTLLFVLCLSGCRESTVNKVELVYKRANYVKDGGSVIVDFIDKDDASVSYLFRKDNKVFAADTKRGRITERSLVSSRLELAALEHVIASYIVSLSSTEHNNDRAKRNEIMKEAESLLQQGRMKEAETLYHQVEIKEEEGGDSDYYCAAKAIEILRRAQKP